MLHATASSDTAEALLEKLVDALLDLFPQAEDVGVLVEDERTQRAPRPGPAPPQRDREHERRSTAPRPSTEPDRRRRVRRRAARARHDHPARRQRSPRRAARRDQPTTTTKRVGTRMGAPLIYHGAHYGVVYVESKTAVVPPGRRRSAAGDRDAGRHGDPRDARRRAARAPRAARARSARRAADPALAPARRRCRRSSASTSRSTTSRRIRSAATSTTSSGTTRRTSGSPSATSPARRSAPRSTWRA